MEHLRDEHLHAVIMRKEAKNKKPFTVNLLFADYDTGSKASVNKNDAHDFWQMELVLEGSVVAYAGRSQTILVEKRIMIIPPSVGHRFVYSAPRKTWSFKFDISHDAIDNPHVMIFPEENDIAMRKLCDLFFVLLDDSHEIPVTLHPALESLISGILAAGYSEPANGQNAPTWLAPAREFIAVNLRKGINLEDVASHLNFTRGHLSRLCRTHLNMKLKDFFDQEVANIAKKKLIYSNKSITTIAAEAGFNDASTFSRFYKRVTSRSPSAQRERVKIERV